MFLIRAVIYYFIIKLSSSSLGNLVILIVYADIIFTLFHVMARIDMYPPNEEGSNAILEKSSVYQQESKKTQIEVDLEQRRMQQAYETQTKEERQKTGLELALEKESFSISDKIVTFDQFGSHSSRATVGVAFDFDTLKICVYEVSNSDVKIVIFPVAEILSLEVVEDGETVSHSTTTGGGGEIKTSSGSMLGRAIVGGVLLGGVGAIIGGATARKTTTTSEAVTHTSTVENVNEIKLKMLVNNTTKPLISIPFLSSPTVRGSTAYTVACKNIEQCEALIKVLMMRASQAKVST